MNIKFKIILILVGLTVLTGCPSEEEVKKIENTILDKKVTALKFLDAKDYSLEGLLKIQDYFFDFSEKVHLMKVEPETQKNIRRLIKSKGVKEFCKNFVIPIKSWESLEQYCSDGSFYKCSPEIKEYKNTSEQFKKLIGTELAKSIDSEPSCK